MARVITINGINYDTKTANKSFLQVAKDLKTAGIKNWYFMLQINDVSLLNVNPYKSNEKTGEVLVTKDQIDRINLECRRNPWYYLREISRIPTPGYSNGVPYIANRGNIAQAWCFIHGIDSWLCLTRQQGKTKSALAIQGWGYSFGTENSTFLFINKDGENARMNLRDLVDQLDLLPPYMRFTSIMEEDGKVTKEINNATRLWHPITHNEIIVKSKASSYTDALSKGRGMTAPIMHFDKANCRRKTSLIAGNFYPTQIDTQIYLSAG